MVEFKKKKEYSDIELKNIGYEQLNENIIFKNIMWNCFIYSDINKYNILYEILKIWEIIKIDIIIISELYNDLEYKLFENINKKIREYNKIDVSFENIYIKNLDDKKCFNYLENNINNKKNNKKNYLIILNEPVFTINYEIHKLLKNKSYYIVFDKNINNYTKYLDYIIFPSKLLNYINKIFKTSYPIINNDNIYILFTHEYLNNFIIQQNYIKLY